MSGTAAAANAFATGAPGRRRSRPSPRHIRWLIVAVLVVLWEVLPRAGLIPVLFLPPLSATLRAALSNAGEYADALSVTLYEIVVAMAFACGGGIIAGAVVGGLAPLRRLLLPLASSLYAVPIVVLYPVFTAWLGIGPEAKICFAAVYGFFPTLLGTAAGIRTIDPQYLIAARSMGATLPQRVVRVIIPAAIPTVLSGLRLGGALVIVGVVVAEMLTSSAGIGYLISRYRTTLDSPNVFAAILLVLALAVAFDGAVKLIERRTATWRFAGRRRAGEVEPGRIGAADDEPRAAALARTTHPA
jgi:NitT/TauT family transport system permease protein/taurine transport system permease protein